MHNEFKIRMGEANSLTPITSARGHSFINDKQKSSMNMSYYSGFSGTRAFSGAPNQMKEKQLMNQMNLTKRENSMDHMGMSIGTPGYHTIQNEGS